MERPRDRRPWGLIIALALAAAAGVASIPLQVAVLRQGDAASAAAVERNASLTQQLADSQASNAADAKAFREDSRRLTLAICDQIEAIAARAQIAIPSCPRVATNPTPSPSPGPSAVPS